MKFVDRGGEEKRLTREAALAEWRQNWKLPIVSAIAYAAGVYYMYTLGLFVDPLQEEFGWSKSQITFGLTVLSGISVVLIPIIGWYIDRHGPRRIAIFGMMYYCAAFAALGLAGKSIWIWWVLWAFLGLGSVCVQGVVWTVAVVSRFNASRGLAIAVTLCGSGIGSTTAPLIANTAINLVGWRAAFPLIGAFMALCVLPGLILFFYGAGDKQRGEPALDTPRKIPIADPQALRAAVKSPNFLKLTAASCLIVMSVTSLLVHFVPILVDAGNLRDTAAQAAALIGIGSIVGRLAAGWLLDRVHGALVGAVVFALPIIVVISLGFLTTGPFEIFVIAFILGLALGSEIDVIGYLTSRYVGTNSFGTLFGVITGLQVLSLGIGPPLLGLAYDTIGSYQPVLWVLIPLFAIASLLIASLGPYPESAQPAAK